MKLTVQRIKFTLQENKEHLFFYISGFILIGLGVNMMKASALGNGAWDTVTINIRAFFNQDVGLQWVTIGMISFLISLIIMTIVIVYRKKTRYLFMLVPIFLVAIFIDFWNIVVFNDQEFTNTIIQILFYGLGIFVLPFGLTCIIKSSFPAFVFDELMLMIADILHTKKIGYVRLGIELLGISIGLVFGYIVYYQLSGDFGAVNVGSVIFTILLPPIMAFQFKLLKVQNNG